MVFGQLLIRVLDTSVQLPVRLERLVDVALEALDLGRSELGLACGLLLPYFGLCFRYRRSLELVHQQLDLLLLLPRAARRGGRRSAAPNARLQTCAQSLVLGGSLAELFASVGSVFLVLVGHVTEL